MRQSTEELVLALLHTLTHSYEMDELSALIQALKDSQMSQEKLAKLSGVRQATISRTLRGITTPDLDTIRKLSAALGVRAQSSNLGFGGTSAPPGQGLLADSDIETALQKIAKHSPAQAEELRAEQYLLRAKILRQAEQLGQKQDKSPKTAAA